MELSILIVSYKTCELTRACLESIQGRPQALDQEIWLVDNASEDGTVEMVRGEFPEVRLVALETNIGFARAVNLAAEKAVGEYLLLLNPDTVVHGDALERLVAFARAHPEHGLYGGRTLAPGGEVDPSSCWGAPSLWSLFCFATGLSTALRRSATFDPESLGAWQRDSVREVDVVTGCLCLVPRSLWESLGGLDPRYFMYGEDVDLCLRAAAAGWRPVITPDAAVTHVVGASSKRRSDKKILVMKGKATLLHRHWRPGARRLGLVLLTAGVGLRALGALLSGGRTADSWTAVWRARRDWLAGYPAVDASR